MRMNLYYLSRRQDLKHEDRKRYWPFSMDHMAQCYVFAENEYQARVLANQKALDENGKGKEVWLDQSLTNCVIEQPKIGFLMGSS